jgi:chemotaxis methyl-accepting protein methylase
MQSEHDLNISLFDTDFLGKCISRRMKEFQLTDPDDYARQILPTPSEPEALYQAVINSFSEFFRNPLTFAILEQHILPMCIKCKLESGQKNIRIWSAGCAAGQEPYSLAIVLEDALERYQDQLCYQIFATDFSTPALQQALLGRYETNTLLNVQYRWLSKYFIPQGSEYKICSRIKEKVAFSQYDLCDPGRSYPPASIYGEFDIVMCSNLLFYYKPEIRQAILGKLYNSLVPNGILITGEAERDCVAKFQGYIPMNVFAPIYTIPNVK